MINKGKPNLLLNKTRQSNALYAFVTPKMTVVFGTIKSKRVVCFFLAIFETFF